METTFQTSFIPKQPVTEQKQSRVSSSVNILLFLSVIIFIVSVIAAGLVYFYKATLNYKEVETDKEDAALKVTLKGLKGGHSGLEIHEGRGNANKLMVRFVREAIEE